MKMAYPETHVFEDLVPSCLRRIRKYGLVDGHGVSPGAGFKVSRLLQSTECSVLSVCGSDGSSCCGSVAAPVLPGSPP